MEQTRLSIRDILTGSEGLILVKPLSWRTAEDGFLAGAVQNEPGRLNLVLNTRERQK
jgi:hypothetical protein